MPNIAKAETMLNPSEIIQKMQSEMFKKNLSEEVQKTKVGLEPYKTITSELEAASANGVLQVAKKIRKIGEDKRKEKTAALDNTKKIAIDAERSFFAELDAQIKAVSDALLAFKQEELRKANEAAAAIKEQAEKDAKRKRSVAGVAAVEAEAQEKLSNIAPVTGMRKVWDYSIEDISKVPAEYMMLDEAKVKQAIKNGERNIPGLVIAEKYGLSGR